MFLLTMGLLLHWLPLKASPETPKEMHIALYPHQVVSGQVASICVPLPTPATPPALAIHFQDQEISVIEVTRGKKHVHCGFVAIPLETKTGSYDISIAWGDTTSNQSKTVSLKVREGKFKETKLKVDPNITKPNEEEQQRIAKEKEEMKAAYSNPSPTPLWQGGFRFPTKGSITSRFGSKRSFNGEVKSVHQGVDLRAGSGTPIYAGNAGKIILAKAFFYAGNMVVIDHGMGIFSSYGHLSTIKVSPGQTIKKGEELGLAGATGRVTGPHLHWGIRVNGILVDPHQLRKVFNHLVEGKRIPEVDR